jgi:hypothetical protein
MGGQKVAVLALAAGLLGSGSGAPARGCSPVAIGTAHTSHAPQSPAPQHPGFVPAASPREWEGWWQSRRRPQAVRSIIHVNGRAVTVIADALLPGWQHPCTAGDLERVLGELPTVWTARLTSVRLTYHPEWDAHARTDRARIEISYVVDQALHAPGELIVDSPEEVQFGARIEGRGNERCFAWPDHDTLRTYILRHVLIHELGHHVAPAGMGRDQEEDWAEAFAFRYYTPAAARVAAVR